MNTFKNYIIILFSFTVCMSCNNKANNTKQNEDILALIKYPSGYDTIVDCSKFGPDWRPYPCLELDKKTLEEIKSIYDEPNSIYVDTFLYGKPQNHMSYWPDIDELLSNVPFAKVTYGYWELSKSRILILYFIEHNKQDVVFYGFRYNPYTIMVE